MEFIKLAESRFSVRSMSSRPVEDEKIDLIIRAAAAAPTAINTQPFKIFVLKSPEAIAKLRTVTKSHFNAPVAMVIANDPKADGYTRSYDWRNFNDVDTTIAATHMMLEIHDLGLGTTWVGHFNLDRMKEEFPQMKDYELLALFPVGYPAEDVKAPVVKKRKTAEELTEVL